MGNAAYKKRHNDLGLCVECSRPKDGTSVRCKKHRIADNTRGKKWQRENSEAHSFHQRCLYYKRKDNNKCPSCGAPLDVDGDKGKTTCSNCREGLPKETVYAIFQKGDALRL